jgi:hypothetical protein
MLRSPLRQVRDLAEVAQYWRAGSSQANCRHVYGRVDQVDLVGARSVRRVDKVSCAWPKSGQQTEKAPINVTICRRPICGG